MQLKVNCEEFWHCKLENDPISLFFQCNIVFRLSVLLLTPNSLPTMFLVKGLVLKTLARRMMDFCMLHYFISCNSMNDSGFTWLYITTNTLFNIHLPRNGFICLIQIKLYFHHIQNSLFKGRIIGNKVKKHFNWYLFSMKYFCPVSLIHHRSGSKI